MKCENVHRHKYPLQNNTYNYKWLSKLIIIGLSCMSLFMFDL